MTDTTSACHWPECPHGAQCTHAVPADADGPLTRSDLVDADDGENRAVRSFLMHYLTPGLTIVGMREAMEMSGWAGCWPDWVQSAKEGTHLTKSGAQQWIRHLFALEPVFEVDRDAPVTGVPQRREVNSKALRAPAANSADTKSLRTQAALWWANDARGSFDSPEWQALVATIERQATKDAERLLWLLANPTWGMRWRLKNGKEQWQMVHDGDASGGWGPARQVLDVAMYRTAREQRDTPRIEKA